MYCMVNEASSGVMNISRLKKKHEIREKYMHTKNPCFTVCQFKVCSLVSINMYVKQPMIQ